VLWAGLDLPGQRAAVRKILTGTARALGRYLRGGGLVPGLEPSCTAVLRSDAAKLVPPRTAACGGLRVLGWDADQELLTGACLEAALSWTPAFVDWRATSASSLAAST
jgi:hypothetical protein